MQKLVSILIPAFNAEETIASTLESAIAQTWPRTEIVVVDDGSRDNTAAIARSYASKTVLSISVPNGGAAAARNRAFELCQGDYVQWLDADDLLAPDKIALQLAALREEDSSKTLLSCPWAPFYYRTDKARIVLNSLCQDLSPVDWLLRKMTDNAHMQTATWLTSRELTEAAGPWDTRLATDDDGEYFCRILLASERVRFVPQAKVFYRMSPSGRVSQIGSSNKKKEAMLTSMKLHIRYLQSLEKSERVRQGCLSYLKTWYPVFYLERQDLAAELQSIAANLGGRLEEPRLQWKFSWMRFLLGWKIAKRIQDSVLERKGAILRYVDKMLMGRGDRSSTPGEGLNNA